MGMAEVGAEGDDMAADGMVIVLALLEGAHDVHLRIVGSRVDRSMAKHGPDHIQRGAGPKHAGRRGAPQEIGASGGSVVDTRPYKRKLDDARDSRAR